ncbi:MAG: arsenate reductase ArsC [Planctomycetota bacterium]
MDSIPPKKRYLVLCTGNRCRSQMAHGYLAHLGGDAVEVRSAGTKPKGVHPLAIEVMQEVGIDISGHTSDHVDAYRDKPFDCVITVCDHAKEACPVFPGAARTLHQGFEDPDDEQFAQQDPEAFAQRFRRIRDEIGAWAEGFLADEGVRTSAQ